MEKTFFILALLSVVLPTLIRGEESLESIAQLDQSLNKIFSEHVKQISAADFREARDSNYFPKIKKKRKKIRTCQNMAGILGAASQCQFSLI